jgi:RNA polymerase sigma factor (sigma-70 family)
MASGTLGGALWYFQNLFHNGTAVGLGDGQLLARYAQSRDEAAFEALVKRHGPMVLATCRAVLKHEHDVEDAFQATFLVLARKARSVRAGEALGGWLHRVAYNAAVETSDQSRRRRQLEAEAAARIALKTPDQTETMDHNEIPAVVHEELDRLPDRQRLPLILCDLDGLTYDQAARHLRWTEPTLRHRLAKARLALRDRLVRRGITAAIVGQVLGASMAETRAAIPAALARATVVAATSGRSSATVAPLATLILKGMLMARLKIATIGILIATVLMTAGFVAVGAVKSSKRGPASKPRLASVIAQNVPFVATAQPPAPAADGRGIEGRIVDLKGRPVAGAWVELANLWAAPDNDLDRWLSQVKDRGVSDPFEGLRLATKATLEIHVVTSRGRLQPPPGSSTTDADGRFHLSGVGLNQVALIRVTSPTIATSEHYVLGRDGAEVRATLNRGVTPSEIVYHPRKLDYAAAPTKPVDGVVRDKDTGRPLSGVVVHGAVYDEHSLCATPGIEAVTDDQGHYRLIGLPTAPAYRIFVEPRNSGPYLKAAFRAAGDTPAFEPVTFDIKLKRGVLVRGKVTDKLTGEQVFVMVDVFAFADNPHLREFPGFQSGSLAHFAAVGGRYEIVAPPGRDMIAAATIGYPDRYRRSVGAKALKGYDPKTGFRTLPEMLVASNYNVMTEIDLDPKVETVEIDLRLDAGRTVTVNPVDSDGHPVAGTTALGVGELPNEYPQATSAIQIFGLDPSQPRRVIVKHVGRKLIGTAYLKGDEIGPLTMKLQPYGTITGRIVDNEGRPRAGVGISSTGGSMPERPAEQGILPVGNISGGIRLGSDGRFRIEGLVPGLKYDAGASGKSTKQGFTYLGELFHDVILAPGEIKDLGDIKPRNRF